MKKILFFAAFIITAVSTPLYAQEPGFEINNSVAVYESIMEGEKLIHTFVFKNSGDKKLEIKNMRALG
jgi:hypothetical protein